MKPSKILFLLLSLLPFFIMAQNTFDSVNSDDGKMVGNHIQQIIDEADSLRKLNDSLSLVMDSMQKESSTNQPELGLLNHEIKFITLSLSILVLVFASLLIFGILYIHHKSKVALNTFAFQIVGTIIVIAASLFLVVTGYDKDQITPIIGLLGTIIGFIFGSNANAQKNNNT